MVLGDAGWGKGGGCGAAVVGPSAAPTPAAADAATHAVRSSWPAAAPRFDAYGKRVGGPGHARPSEDTAALGRGCWATKRVLALELARTDESAWMDEDAVLLSLASAPPSAEAVAAAPAAAPTVPPTVPSAAAAVAATGAAAAAVGGVTHRFVELHGALARLKPQSLHRPQHVQLRWFTCIQQPACRAAAAATRRTCHCRHCARLTCHCRHCVRRACHCRHCASRESACGPNRACVVRLQRGVGEAAVSLKAQRRERGVVAAADIRRVGRRRARQRRLHVLQRKRECDMWGVGRGGADEGTQ
eukprot:359095-Chlamydomonas_euryale.AAC.2